MHNHSCVVVHPSPTDLARQLHAALERGAHGDELRDLFTDDAITLEHPNQLKPSGATADLATMLAASAAGASLLATQRYEIRDAIEQGDTAAIRLEWRGVIAQDAGPFRAGQELVAHIAQFVSARDGRIAAIETFDCYEPFG